MCLANTEKDRASQDFLSGGHNLISKLCRPLYGNFQVNSESYLRKHKIFQGNFITISYVAFGHGLCTLCTLICFSQNAICIP